MVQTHDVWVEVHRTKTGRAPYRWEIHSALAKMALRQSVQTFRTMDAAYETGSKALREIIASRLCQPAAAHRPDPADGMRMRRRTGHRSDY